VLEQYEIAEAQARYESALSNNFKITPGASPNSFRLGDGAPMETKLSVEFKTGQRAWKTEEVQGFSEEALREVIKSVLDQPEGDDPDEALSHPREKLRPHLLPLYSPRVFWSLMWLKGGGQECVERALKSILPDRNWEFLQQRARRRTDKARALENTKGQHKHGTQLPDPSVDDLHEVVPGAQDRKRLKAKKITSLVALADLSGEVEGVNPEWVEQARSLVMRRLMRDIVDNDEEIIKKFEANDVSTPEDVSRLRIPGRTEHYMRVLGGRVTKEVIEQWRSKADSLAQRYPWLKDYYQERRTT